MRNDDILPLAEAIAWKRLSLGRPFWLATDEAWEDLARIWRAALQRSSAEYWRAVRRLGGVKTILYGTEKQWTALYTDLTPDGLQLIIDRYFQGEDAEDLVYEIEGGRHANS